MNIILTENVFEPNPSSALTLLKNIFFTLLIILTPLYLLLKPSKLRS